MNQKLHYILDPMCSWCYAFRNPWEAFLDVLPADIEIEYVMGGLAPDSAEPMPQSLREYIQSTWRAIEQRTGASFNHRFWSNNTPRRSTYPACRAVIAADLQDRGKNREMIRAIQDAYYLQARNPSDKATLVTLAGDIGLNRERFVSDLHSDHVEDAFNRDLQRTVELGIGGFPSVVFESQQGLYALNCGYCDASELLQRWRALSDAMMPAE